jgi:hypothetical protein
MIESSQIIAILNDSPSVELLKSKNREIILVFLVNTFSKQQGSVSSESIHVQLADYLEYRQVENDEENEISIFDTYEIKAKKYIQNWTNKGFLTNYQDEHGDIFYELSSHSSKTIDWLSSLKKEEYIGTESKFKTIFNQLKELVEFTNEDIPKRIQLLEDKKMEIEQQIERIRSGEDVKIFEEYEMVPRFKQLNQSAKELLSDFKEVEDNFKEITKEIYRRHADGNRTKSDILEFTFDALDELKDSQQGKSFYAFWSFLLNPDLQSEWENLTTELYETLEKKGIEITDFFLKGMKRHLHLSGQKVYKANDRMAEKLSRIIRENQASKTEATRSTIQEIKRLLIEISKTKQKPFISLELETDIEISIPFERKLTIEQSEVIDYTNKPQLADNDILESEHITRLFIQSVIDRDILRKRVKDVLREKSQVTLLEVIESSGEIQKGLSEVFGYIGIIKEFRYTISSDKTQTILFDKDNNKSIRIPEIIITK